MAHRRQSTVVLLEGTTRTTRASPRPRRPRPAGRELALPHRRRRHRARGLPREGAGAEPAAAARPLLRRHRHGRPALRGRRGDARRRSEIARLDHGQIQCLCPARATARSSSAPAIRASCTSCEDRYAARGTVVSEVLDAKIVSKWGSLRWQAETPDGTRRDRGGPQRQRRRAGRHLERLVRRADRRRQGPGRRRRPPASCSTASR